MSRSPDFGCNENFPFKCQSITLNHFSMPAETKLRIANSDPFFEISDLWEVKNFDDLDFHDLCQQNGE